jgi:hypothetical protein
MFARFVFVVALLAIAIAALARTSSGHGAERVYIVRPADTLWAIAAARYGGDPREGVWKIQQRNHLAGTLLRPGERIVLP